MNSTFLISVIWKLASTERLGQIFHEIKSHPSLVVAFSFFLLRQLGCPLEWNSTVAQEQSDANHLNDVWGQIWSFQIVFQRALIGCVGTQIDNLRQCQPFWNLQHDWKHLLCGFPSLLRTTGALRDWNQADLRIFHIWSCFIQQMLHTLMHLLLPFEPCHIYQSTEHILTKVLGRRTSPQSYQSAYRKTSQTSFRAGTNGEQVSSGSTMPNTSLTKQIFGLNQTYIKNKLVPPDNQRRNLRVALYSICHTVHELVQELQRPSHRCRKFPRRWANIVVPIIVPDSRENGFGREILVGFEKSRFLVWLELIQVNSYGISEGYIWGPKQQA